MKNLFAHADKDRNLCVEECCIAIEEFSFIVNTISKVLKYLDVNSKCSINLGLYNKLSMIKNLSINIVGRFTSLHNLVISGRLAKEIDVSINTLCNLANGVVELRNQVKEVLDSDLVADCRYVKDHLENVTSHIDNIGLKLLIIALNLIKEYPDIPQMYSGKIASSLASLLFASLLSIHNKNVKKALDQCFARI
ncbi:MAG: hypothetical protein LM582_00810 [Desulfurococcaceae archaeon]|nr:hypothetical protein [Desulfurococcaceae archaeon]